MLFASIVSVSRPPAIQRDLINAFPPFRSQACVCLQLTDHPFDLSNTSSAPCGPIDFLHADVELIVQSCPITGQVVESATCGPCLNRAPIPPPHLHVDAPQPILIPLGLDQRSERVLSRLSQVASRDRSLA